MGSVIHEIAKAGFGSGTNELYDRARPTYPAGTLSFMRSKLPETGKLNVIEIGSGTGLFTRALLAHPEWKDSLGSLHAVDPSEGMRNTFTARTNDSRVTVNEGTFIESGEQQGWADGLVIAQAFHWAHPNYDAAMKEIARVLKPNGTAFFVWNVEDREKAHWVAVVRDYYEAYEKGTPQVHHNMWEATFQTPSYVSAFHPPERFTTEWSVPTTKSAVQDRILTESYITQLSDEKKAILCDKIGKVLEKEDKKWIDQGSGVFEYPYKTTVVAMKKLS